MIIAVDFDGTLCDESEFPKIGKPRQDIINWVKLQKTLEHKKPPIKMKKMKYKNQHTSRI